MKLLYFVASNKSMIMQLGGFFTGEKEAVNPQKGNYTEYKNKIKYYNMTLNNVLYGPGVTVTALL